MVTPSTSEYSTECMQETLIISTTTKTDRSQFTSALSMDRQSMISHAMYNIIKCTHAFMHDVHACIHNVTVYILLISCSNYWWTMHKAIVSLQACRQSWIYIYNNELQAFTLIYYCIIATVNVYNMLYIQRMLQSCTATLPTVDILQV